MTKSIPLTQGKFALVDDEDYEYINKFKWHALYTKSVNNHYAERSHNRNHLLMHRVIMNPPEGMQVDHIDGDTLNNQKSNLRICTNAQNSRNRGVNKDNKVGLKGVTKHGNKFRATIKTNGKQIHIGLYTTPKEAATAYDSMAKKIHGEFANLNFPN